MTLLAGRDFVRYVVLPADIEWRCRKHAHRLAVATRVDRRWLVVANDSYGGAVPPASRIAEVRRRGGRQFAASRAAGGQRRAAWLDELDDGDDLGVWCYDCQTRRALTPEIAAQAIALWPGVTTHGI